MEYRRKKVQLAKKNPLSMLSCEHFLQETKQQSLVSWHHEDMWNNSQNSPASHDVLDGEFWEMKSTNLKDAKFEKHWNA